ncbi:hypothetical protein PLICRDRAFT_57432 [Plicaturopsis crispa FD-325 SS-3]|uniref:Uncharacterized protein n=1 Tax=Plicaturopsis crispa FD-325 SS-3 TaxID=944288 RepID=A0A0C9SL62_PLICR|nr:hypothetical protein PLICRDRAFT_57432 [Plicaturopsis crispa FD-325 SS-3]
MRDNAAGSAQCGWSASLQSRWRALTSVAFTLSRFRLHASSSSDAYAVSSPHASINAAQRNTDSVSSAPNRPPM